MGRRYFASIFLLLALAIAIPAAAEEDQDEEAVLGGLIITTNDVAAAQNAQEAAPAIHKELRGATLAVNEVGVDAHAASGAVVASDAREAGSLNSGDVSGAMPAQVDVVATVDLGDKRTANIVLGEIVWDGEKDSVSGLDERTLVQVIRANLGGVRSCYERYLKLDPDLSGRLVVNVTVGEDGSVSRVRVSDDTLGHSEMSAAVVRRVEAWRFPAPAAGPFTFSYPFNFVQSL